MMKIGALGIYDSGVGGKDVLREIKKILPEIKVHFLQDSKALPIGEKTITEIQEIVKEGVQFLYNKGCSLILLACNTATVASIKYIQQVWNKENLPHKNVLGISPLILEIMNTNHSELKNKKGIVISTPATYNSGFYQLELKKVGFNNVVSVPCSGLEMAIEENDQTEINKLLIELKDKTKHIKTDFIILACTHYPLIMEQLSAHFPSSLIINPAPELALRLKDYIKRHNEFQLVSGNTHYWST